MKWHTREDSGLRIDRLGRWWHDDQPIEHPNIIEAFNQGLRVTADGKYQLHFGGDWAFVTVEQCGFVVVAVDQGEGERLSVRLSDRTAEWLDSTSLTLDDEGVLTVKVKEGLGLARFSRQAQFQIAEFFTELDGLFLLQVGSTIWPTGVSAG